MQNFVVEYCIGTLKGMLVQVLLKIFDLLVVSFTYFNSQLLYQIRTLGEEDFSPNTELLQIFY